MSSNANPATGWIGWIGFASLILVVSGLINIVQGLTAIIGPNTYYLAVEGTLIAFDVASWGWWSLVLGLLTVIIAGALITGRTWARIVAVIIALVSLTGQLLLLPAQPWLSLVVIAVDVLIIYAVTVHGKELKHD